MAQAPDAIDMVYFGNPIFDMSVNDTERTVMSRYSLELGMVTLATPEQMPIYDEIWSREDKITSPGGSALNSARAQKFANPNGAVEYFGCIGNDDKGRALHDAVTAAGIGNKFEVTEAESTGVCAAVIVDKERTLCANIGAAKKFTMDYYNANAVSSQPRSLFHEVKFFIYLTGSAEPRQIPLHDWLLC